MRETLLEEACRVRAEADCLATRATVDAAYARMAAEITQRLRSANPLVYVVMHGGLVVAGQLLPRLDFPLETGYLHATRYGHALNGAELDWHVKPTHDPAGRSVLVIDDILDEGHTLNAVIQACEAEGAADVRVAVLARKIHDRCVPGLTGDYVGIEVPDRYVFGFGMDYYEQGRNLPGIYALR